MDNTTGQYASCGCWIAPWSNVSICGCVDVDDSSASPDDSLSSSLLAVDCQGSEEGFFGDLLAPETGGRLRPFIRSLDDLERIIQHSSQGIL